LLIVSSFGIDVVSCFVLTYSVLGPSVGPFLGLMLLFFLRQACQALCALPPPKGMIWRAPALPSLLVTYGTTNDLFFSGHTALAVYGSIVLAQWGGPPWALVGVLIAVFEMATVIVLRAHYTMDVFAGAVTAFAAAVVATWAAPACDQWLIELGQRIGLG
jgi:membrane-associated phospholipid phosphatase